MKTKEYFADLKGLERDNFHPEFHSYVATYIRARSPQLYTEVASHFKNVEGEIYAQLESNHSDVF